MKITLGAEPTVERFAVPNSDIVLIFRRPTYAERIKEYTMSGEDWIKVRMGCLCGIDGVEFVDKDGKEIAFSQKAFAQACEVIDGLFDQALVFSAQLFRGIDRKNLPSPSIEAAETTEAS